MWVESNEEDNVMMNNQQFQSLMMGSMRMSASYGIPMGGAGQWFPPAKHYMRMGTNPCYRWRAGHKSRCSSSTEVVSLGGIHCSSNLYNYSKLEESDHLLTPLHLSLTLLQYICERV